MKSDLNNSLSRSHRHRGLSIMKCVLLSTTLALTPNLAEAQQNKAYVVSEAHFDTQWNWDVQQSISEFIPKTMRRNFMLIQKYPHYVFNFEGAVKYAWMKEYYPEDYEFVKKYVHDGRWHVTGSLWDATDINMPAPEAVTRNILYGQWFYRDEFGTASKDIFLPDCFGFGWQLPTVAAHSGLIGFSTQKLQWRHRPFYGSSKIPFRIGLWQGVDGQRIVLVADGGNYTTKWNDGDLSHNKELLAQAQESPIHATYHYYGTGDTGGSPTIGSVRAVEKGVNGDGPLQIISATSDQLYQDLLPFDKHPELPVFNGELLMDVHGTGCYTSQAAMKLFNRRNELLGAAAECAAVTADWMKVLPYPKDELTNSWKRFIWHGFHDDLTGTSIPRAYEFSWNDELLSLKDFSSVMSSSVGAVSRSLDTRVKGTPVVAYNPSAFEASDVVKLTLPHTSSSVSLYDRQGNPVPSQVIASKGDSVALLTLLQAPSLGYQVYDVRKGTGKVSTSLVAGDHSLENSVYKLTLNANGDISSIIDKRSGRELVEQGKAIRLALFTENKSVSWPAWEIMKSEIDKAPVSITDDAQVSIAERGPVRAALKVTRRYGDSKFTQYVCLNAGAQADRIDIINEVDWATTNALLKAEFPLAISSPKATYDLGIGTVDRGNNTDTAYEVYGHQWADMKDAADGYGVAVLNNCKYGWDKPNDHLLRLTLIHTPGTEGNYTYQNRQDFGKHYFTYSIVAHDSKMTNSQITRKAQVLNQSLYAFTAPKHAGALGKEFSLGACDNENVLLKAFKQAEKGQSYIVRFYETAGKSEQKATFSFCAPIAKAEEVNGMEDTKGAATFSGNDLTFTIKPYSIKSFRVTLQSPDQTPATAVQTPLTLPFDLCATTYNAFRQTGNFDGKGNSYAAELFPKTVTFKGVTFKMGEPDADNALKCHQQELRLPAGHHNRVYLLMASTQNDLKATFMVDGRPQTVEVPYYSGFIGQWGHKGQTEAYVKSADVAFVGTHKHTMIGNKDLPYEFTYMFCVPLQVNDKTRSITLPDNKHVVVFAATALDDVNNNGVNAVSDLQKVYLPVKHAVADDEAAKNLAKGKPVIERTGQVNNRERAELAVDGDETTKWCDTGLDKNKYITIDLGETKEIKGWYVLHAGLEDLDYITKEFCLQVKTDKDSEWQTVDSVSDNLSLETNRLLDHPVKARYVRLFITKPDQSEGHVARIYEFSVQ